MTNDLCRIINYQTGNSKLRTSVEHYNTYCNSGERIRTHKRKYKSYL